MKETFSIAVGAKNIFEYNEYILHAFQKKIGEELVFIIILSENITENQHVLDHICGLFYEFSAKSAPLKLNLKIVPQEESLLSAAFLRKSTTTSPLINIKKLLGTLVTFNHITLDLSNLSLDENTVIDLVNFLQSTPLAFFSMSLADNPLGPNALVRIANALVRIPPYKQSFYDPVGLQLNLRNTLNSERLVDNAKVGEAFGKLFSEGTFPKYLALNLDVGWVDDSRLATRELILAAINSLPSETLFRLSLQKIVTNNAKIDIQLAKQIQIASEIFSLMRDSKSDVQIPIISQQPATPAAAAGSAFGGILESLKRRNAIISHHIDLMLLNTETPRRETAKAFLSHTFTQYEEIKRKPFFFEFEAV